MTTTDKLKRLFNECIKYKYLLKAWGLKQNYHLKEKMLNDDFTDKQREWVNNMYRVVFVEV